MKMDFTMAYRVFTLSVHDPGAAEHELNGFLASHRVLSVDRRFVEEGERSFWSFCVDFVDARRGLPSFCAARSSRERNMTADPLTWFKVIWIPAWPGSP
jgi:hypothetical protein